MPWAAARQISLLNRHPESFKVYIEAVTGVRHVPSPGSLSSTFLSQGYVLGQRLVPGRQVEHVFHIQGRDWEPPAAQVQLLGQTGDDLPNRPFAFHLLLLAVHFLFYLFFSPIRAVTTTEHYFSSLALTCLSAMTALLPGSSGSLLDLGDLCHLWGLCFFNSSVAFICSCPLAAKAHCGMSPISVIR